MQIQLILQPGKNHRRCPGQEEALQNRRPLRNWDCGDDGGWSRSDELHADGVPEPQVRVRVAHERGQVGGADRGQEPADDAEVRLLVSGIFLFLLSYVVL